MKKTAAFLGALLIAFSAFSCGTKKGGDNKLSTPTSINSASKLVGMAYAREEMKLPSELQNGYFLAPYEGGKKYILFGSSGSWQPTFWNVTNGLRSYTQVDFPDFDYGVNYNIALADNGTIVTLVIHADYGDLPEPDYNSPDYDEAEYDEAAEYSFIINSYSVEGELLSLVTVDEKCPIEPSRMTGITTLCTDGKFVLAEIDGAFEMFDVEGKYYGELKKGDASVTGIGNDITGQLVCAVESGEDQIMLCKLDENGNLTDSDMAYNLDETIFGAMMPGSDEYSLYIRTVTTIYGIRSEDGGIDALFDVVNAGVSRHDIKGFRRGKDGNFVILTCDFQNPTALTRFVPRSGEEIEDMDVLTIGIIGTKNEQEQVASKLVKPWNDDSSHDFFVGLKFYEVEGANTLGFDQIARDALSGSLPDIFKTNSAGSFGDLNLFDKGMVCDLYEFMDKDEVYNRDYFIPNALKCLEHDGKLTAITDRFYLDLGFCAKKKIIGNADEWSLEKKLQLTLDPPIKVEKDPYQEQFDSKLQRVDGDYYSLRWQNWVDLEHGTCNFKDPLFIKFLEYCNEADIVEFDYENYVDPTESMTEKEKQEWWNERTRKEHLAIREDRDIWWDFEIGNYENYRDITLGRFGGEKLTFINEPKLSFGWGSDLFAVNAKSERKDQAWEYIRSLFAYERYENANYRDERGYRGTGGFPITKDGLNYDAGFAKVNYPDYSQSEYTKDDPDWKDYKGLCYEVDYHDYSYNIKIGEVSDEDIAAVNHYIDIAKPDNYINLTDNKYYEIAREELLRYFNGSCTAEQCADAMQSRLSIYLSEKYST